MSDLKQYIEGKHVRSRTVGGMQRVVKNRLRRVRSVSRDGTVVNQETQLAESKYFVSKCGQLGGKLKNTGKREEGKRKEAESSSESNRPTRGK